MSPLNVSLGELVNRLDADLPEVDPLAKISEAQLRSHTLAALGDQLVGHYVAIAKDKGASWTEIGEAIGVSKQAAQQKWVPQIFAHFTDLARHSVVLAQESARTHKHSYIGAEHVLLGVLGEPRGLAVTLLVEQAGSTDAVREAVQARMAPDGKKAPRGHIAFAPHGKEALEQANEQARALGHDFVGTEHVLLGVLAVTEGIAAQALGGLGIELEAMRTTVAQRIADALAKKA
jgi:hypothetical protein